MNKLTAVVTAFALATSLFLGVPAPAYANGVPPVGAIDSAWVHSVDPDIISTSPDGGEAEGHEQTYTTAGNVVISLTLDLSEYGDDHDLNDTFSLKLTRGTFSGAYTTTSSSGGDCTTTWTLNVSKTILDGAVNCTASAEVRDATTVPFEVTTPSAWQSTLFVDTIITDAYGEPDFNVYFAGPVAANDIYVGSYPVYGDGSDPCDSPDYSTDDHDIQVSLASAMNAVDHDGDVIIICEGAYEYDGDIAEYDGSAEGAHPSITIRADDGASVVLDGGASVNFQLLDFVSTDVSISGLVFQRGGDEFGGGISVVGGTGRHTLTVRDSAFYLNQAWFGAAIYAENMSVDIADTTFGAAAEDDETGLIYEGANVASFEGGALFVTTDSPSFTPAITVDHTNFISNTAEEYGGAITVTGAARLEVAYSRFVGNETLTAGVGCGGAIYLLNETGADIIDTHFESNHAPFTGGAIASQTCDADADQHPDAVLTIRGGTFEENSADCAGGAIETLGLVLRDSTFTRNEAGTCAGGAIAVKRAAPGATVELVGNTFTDNALTGDACCEGGALYLWFTGSGSQATPVVRGNTFRGNASSTEGGALTLRGISRVQRIARNLFKSNTAPSGAAISLSSCTEGSARARSRRVIAQLLQRNRFHANRADSRRDANVYQGKEPCAAG